MKADTSVEVRRESRAIGAAWASFAAGALFGLIALAGDPRPIAGDGSIALPAAGIAAIVTGGAFALSTLLHRRGETAPMPAWQTAVSRISAVALTIAFAAVAYLGTLTGGEVLARGLQGLEAPVLGGALLTGIASAAGGWLAFQAGVELATRDLATLLFAYLTIGTVFAMLTADDPRWWERHFSALGAGDGAGAWAFNGTVVIAGLLVATIGAYIGRDLHRALGDRALGGIAWTVGLFGLTGAALAGVGIFRLESAPVLHDLAAFGALGLLCVTAVVVMLVMPGPPRAMLLTTIGAGAAIVVALLLWRPLGVYSAAGLEAVAVGIAFVWLTTLVRTIAALSPDRSRPSDVPSLLGATRRIRPDRVGAAT
ncbi:DUF998 domain-containing protein [Agrococcus sp. HG114]|uniref:DUF998 domain-containing protein n=1 Tax=Agrococcus sp. HG114 TaxID=2969757 RepID=UPI00215A3604|nr:DUF998 domain-containing protein [Agrococcus sp. HG114]MCR8670524.1 DUF998 domain-containing protein [Agrococcus sp. HG114]